MRKQAEAGDQGPTDEQQSGGAFPYGFYRDWAGDPADPTRVSFPFLRRMQGDFMIAFGYHLIEMGLLRAPWYYQSSDARAAALADSIVRPIHGRLIRTILRFIWAGYSPGVKRFKFIDDPGWVYYENGVAKKVWDKPNIKLAVYRPVLPLKPELCRPRWKDGEFNGIKYDGRYGDGYFILNGQNAKQVDLLHSMWATHGQEQVDNSVYGRPRIAGCAPIFHEYWRMWAMIGRAFENNADPGPVMRYPRDDPALEAADGTKLSPVETALTIGRRRRSGSTVALPSDPYATFDDRPSTMTKWGIEYPEHETNFESMMAWIGQLNALKLVAMWISDSGVTGESVTGASSNRNVFEGAGDLRDQSMAVLMAMIDELIDNVFVRPIFAMNMPEFEGTVKKVTLGLDKDANDMIRQVFQLVGQQDWKNFGADIQKLAEVFGLPMLDPQERERQLNQAVAQSQNGGPPVVEPTQGRRALVTQTGFGETHYVQLHDPIALSDDGDFVASLPRTDHFSDSAVVGQARLLRKHSRDYLSALYGDFAIYLGKQRSLESDVIGHWRPKPEREQVFAERVQAVLTNVFDRGAAQHLKDLLCDSTLSVSTSESAKAWVDRRTSDLVAATSTSVRNELSEFLAREVKKGDAPRDVASALRAEFSQWPTRRANQIALAEIEAATNFAGLSAGRTAGVKKAQMLSEGDPRNGRILDISEALDTDGSPFLALQWRLLPQHDLQVVKTALEDGLQARYDEDQGTILLSPDLDAAGEEKYLLMLGENLAKAQVSTNGRLTGDVDLALS